MSRLILILSVLVLTLNAQQTITLRGGNGTPGGPDSLVTFVPGPFTAPFTPADFAAAQAGTPAEILPPGSFGWQANLAGDPTSAWISTNQSSASHTSALFAIPFTVNVPTVFNATLSVSMLVDEMLGDVNNTGLFLNGTPISNTATTGAVNWVNQGTFSSLNVTSLVTPGANVLYVNLINVSGPGGVNFRADLIVAGQAEFQTNQPGAVLHVGTVGTSVAPGRAVRCVNNTAPFVINSVNVGNGWDLAVSTLPLAAASGNGIVLPDGQIVNMELGSTVFLNGASAVPNLLPFPGVISTTLSSPTPIDLSAQAFFLSPSLPLGVAMSAPVEFHALQAGVPSELGPAGDNNSVTVNVTATPYCWSAAGIPMYGTTYPSLSVASNGRVLFGGADDDGSPTVLEALGDNPFVGCWMDLAPNTGGSITISSPAPELVRVDWSAVPHFGQPTLLNSFGIEFNCLTGDIIVDGLQGLSANVLTAQFLGISRGNLMGGATDPGVMTFLPGTAGAAGNAGDMLYDFTVAGPVASLMPGVLNTVIFTPDGGGNYTWTAF